MIFDTIKQVLPPPTEPVDCGTIDSWFAMEEKLKTKLPSDYKWFINTYGTGTFIDPTIEARERCYIFNPFSTDKNTNLFEMIEERIDAYEYLRDGAPED